MHGVSAVIVVIMLLMISVSLAGLAYTFATAMVTETTETGSEMIEQTTSSMLAQMTIESIGDNNVYIRNTGQTDLSSFSVYVNDKSVDISAPSSIPPGQLDSISIHSIINKDDIIKVTSARGTSAIKSVPDPCKSSSVVICLRFDEGSGNIARDSSNYGNDVSLMNMESTDWVDGKYGKALQFDGVNEYLNRTVVNGLSTNGLTISLWSRQDGMRSFFMHSIGVFGGHSATIYASPNTYRYVSKFNSISGVRYEPYIDILDSSWHNFVVAFDGSRIKVFVDDILKVNISAPGSINKIDDSLFIATTGVGTSPSGNWFYGTIDDVRIYNKALY